MLGAARIVSGLLLFLGIVGLLRVGTTGEAEDLFGLTVAPLTAVAWLVLGLVGVALSVQAVRARRYLIGAGALLTLWGLVGLLSGASDVLTDDGAVVALYLVLGVGSLAVALGPTPEFVEKALALPDAEEEATTPGEDEPDATGTIRGVGAPPG
jgi:hypothetical protein